MGVPSHRPVQYAIQISVFGLRVRPRRVGGVGREPGFHHRQPGGRVWRRPVPRPGREMRCPCGAVLLPVAGFCGGLVLPARRPGRNHGIGTQGRRRQLPPRQLQSIRRHHLPTLKSPVAAKIKGFPATPAPRKRRDAAQRSGYVNLFGRASGSPGGFVPMAGYA
jgi:hypothetical protein